VARSVGGSVGIDFGTSTCFVAREIAAGDADILPIGNSKRYLASLAGHIGGSFVVGEDAEVLTPDRVIRSVKSAITENRATVRVGGRDGATEVPRDDVVVAVFREIAKRARDRGWPLDEGRQLRLGCPAMWMGPQRRLLIDLAASAGLSVEDSALIEEPVAAGIAWLNHRIRVGDPVAGRILVFDMGGGTLDLAVMQVEIAERPTIAVLTSVGLPMAGDALDESIVQDLCEEREIDLDSLKDPLQARADLLRQARDTKLALSDAPVQTVYFEPFFYGGKVLPVKYSRDRLNAVFQPQMTHAESLVWRALRLSRLTHVNGTSPTRILDLSREELAADIDAVLLVGGMSRVPYVRDRLAALFPHARRYDHAGGAADEAIVAGIADTTGYNTMNMYRPGLDIALVWGKDNRFPLYEAYTPLFEIWQLQSGQTDLGFPVRAGQRQGIPRQPGGELWVRTAAGEPVELVHTQRTARPTPEKVTTLPVPFGHYDIQFKLYCDGHIHLTDGAGHDHRVRVHGWPVIGDLGDRLDPLPDPPVPYPFNRP